MRVGFGKHNDKSVAVLVLKEPGYIAWALSAANLGGPLARVKERDNRVKPKKYTLQGKGGE
jgi:hypothetical protein